MLSELEVAGPLDRVPWGAIFSALALRPHSVGIDICVTVTHENCANVMLFYVTSHRTAEVCRNRTNTSEIMRGNTHCLWTYSLSVRIFIYKSCSYCNKFLCECGNAPYGHVSCSRLW